MSIFKDKDILVTGGCGSIGSEIVRQLVKHQPERVRVLDNHESGHWHLQNDLGEDAHYMRPLVGDIRDRDRLLRAMEGVDIVFHAAALKHVPLCEYNPFEAVYTNVIGTKNVVETAIQQKVKHLIGISTDKAVNPVNTMGATKLLSERIVISAPVGFHGASFSCVRFGNVLGSEGSVVPLFQRQIKAGGPVTVTDPEMTRFFMTIPQAVRLVLRAAELKHGKEIFVLKMDVVRIQDLAEVMIEELAPRYGHNPEDIEINFIGKRPGEKMHEYLFTEEEAPHIEELEDMFVVRNAHNDPHRIDRSDWEAVWEKGKGRLIGKDEIKEVLKANGSL